MQRYRHISRHQDCTFGKAEKWILWHFESVDNQYMFVYQNHSDSTGKEKDVETGYGYFGARYMDHELMIMWLSVDPMVDKYPAISPYAYCAWNPLKLVDPEGREVEYSSAMDWIRVSFMRIVNSDFRVRFNDLKTSEETYVFNGYKAVGEKGGEFTTDGDKLFINYNIWRNEEQGTHSLVNLRHETEHAVQFEYGEIGFDRTNNPEGNWEHSAVNFDLMDEVKARDIGYFGWMWSSDPNKNVRNSWVAYSNSDLEKIEHLSKSEFYKNCSPTPLNNTNTTKIKTSTQYMLPHRPRSEKY